MKNWLIVILFLIALSSSCKKSPTNSSAVALNQYIESLDTTGIKHSEIVFKFDSIYNFTRRQSPSTENINTLNALSYKASDLGFEQYFVTFENKIQSNSKRIKDSTSLSNSFWRVAQYYEDKAILDSAYTYYDKAATIYTNLKDEQNLAHMNLYKSAILFNEGLYDEAENFAIKALNTIDKRNDYVNFEINIAIANALDLNKQNQAALLYYNKALDIINKIDPHSPIATPLHYYTAKASIYNNIGFSYNTLKDFKKAEQYLLIAEDILSPYALNNPLHPLIINNLGHTFLHLKEYKKAKHYLDSAYTARQNTQSTTGLITSHNRLGEYYLAIQDTLSGLDHLQQSLLLSQDIRSYQTALSALKRLSLADKDKSRYYSGLYYQYADSLIYARLDSRNKFARIEYETLQIQQKNDRLFVTNSRLIIGIFVSICIVILLFVLFQFITRNRKLRYLQIHQNDRETIYKLLLKQENHQHEVILRERERIGRELHDGIINSLFTIRLLIGENDEVTKKNVVGEIEKVQQQIRLISHDLQNKDFISAGYLELLQTLIQSNNNAHTTFKLLCPKSFDWSIFGYEVKMNIYRIIQEAIQNVIKHAQASQCIISIFETQHHYKLIVQDNGIGCDFSSKDVGIGLKNFQDRAREINAEFTITSDKNGTSLQIAIKKDEF